MSTIIHPTAIVAPDAVLGSAVVVGPYAIIGPRVTVGAGSVVGAHAILETHVKVGERVKVGAGSIIGGDPQDLKFKGEETWAEIGDDTVIREFVTVNRGTTQSYRTTVGKGCLLMSYVHLGHDCHLGDGVVVSSSSGLAGHVDVGDKAIINGMTGVQQFIRIGTLAYVGGHSAIRKDVPPYARTDGESVIGLNKIGCQRGGVDADAVEALSAAFRTFFRSSLNISQAVEQVKAEPMTPEVQHLVSFIEASEKGVMV